MRVGCRGDGVARARSAKARGAHRGRSTRPPRGPPCSLLLVALLSIHCASMGAAPAETELTAGVAVNGTTAKDEAAFFQFTLAPYEDAVLNLTMLDGDADVYVLGPRYARYMYQGFGPGPEGARSRVIRHKTGRSASACGDGAAGANAAPKEASGYSRSSPGTTRPRRTARTRKPRCEPRSTPAAATRARVRRGATRTTTPSRRTPVTSEATCATNSERWPS
jgi:hypothetical protein